MPAEPRSTTLPDGFEKLLETADLPTLKAVFDTCAIDARGGYSKLTALMMSGCPDALARWLVEKGADISAVDASGKTALHHRARRRQPGGGSLEVLLELGADPNAGEGGVGTPLHAAADVKHVAAVRTLLASGARVDATMRGGYAPLEVALQGCTNADLPYIVPVVRALLDAGAKHAPGLQAAVRRIGEAFEFHRPKLEASFAAAASAGLAELYELIGVQPVPPRRVHDGNARIHVNETTWQKRHRELWSLLVPSSGAAATVQGEVIRISGRIGDEIHRNGGANWDDQYDAMAIAFVVHLASGNALPAEDVREAQTIALGFRDGNEGDEAGTARLAELAVAWVMRNLAPTALPKPDYRR